MKAVTPNKIKKIASLFMFILICQFACAQYSDKGFSFQGYAIDGDNQALASTGITVRFTVYRTGTSYVEEHATNTDAFGVFSAVVGQGTASSGITFGELNFSNFDFNLKVDVRETSGGTFVTISDKSLSAVPYARSAYNGVPIGTIVPFAGPATAIPDGWLLCDGTALNASTDLKYSQLFSVIGTTWGGSGSTNFSVPDLRGQFLRGLNTTASGEDANRILGSHQDADLSSHTHAATQAAHTHGYTDGFHLEDNFGVDVAPGYTINFEFNPTDVDNIGGGHGTEGNDVDNLLWTRPMTTDSQTPTISVSATGGGETRPVNKAVNYIIKY